MVSWLLRRAGLCTYLSAHRTTACVLAYEIGGESIVNRGNLPPMHPSQRGAPVCSLLTKLGPTKPAEIRPVVQQVHAPATDDAASPLCRYKTGSVISETRGMPLWAERCACHLAPPGCSRAEVALPLAFDKTTKAGKAFSTLNHPAMQGDRAPQLAAARKSHLASMARSRSNGFVRDWSKPPVQQHVRLPSVTLLCGFGFLQSKGTKCPTTPTFSRPTLIPSPTRLPDMPALGLFVSAGHVGCEPRASIG